MSFKNFSTWTLTGTISVLIVVLGYFGDRTLNELVLIRGEITELNVKMMDVVSNQGFFEKWVNKLEIRIEKLEAKKP